LVLKRKNLYQLKIQQENQSNNRNIAMDVSEIATFPPLSVGVAKNKQKTKCVKGTYKLSQQQRPQLNSPSVNLLGLH
jgi:hypothetical protein